MNLNVLLRYVIYSSKIISIYDKVHKVIVDTNLYFFSNYYRKKLDFVR